MMRFLSSVCVLACVACVACSSDEGSGGSGGQSSGGSAGSASGGTSGSGGGQSGGAGGNTQVCGGKSGVTCAASEFCDYEPDSCGSTDATGICTERPSGCAEIYEPTCACDGTVYGNECVAQQAGVDVSDLGGCPPPDGYITCGDFFCDGTLSYCEKATDDTGGPTQYACKTLPTDCVGKTDCTCFTSATPCSDLCDVVAGNGLDGFVLTCPGG